MEDNVTNDLSYPKKIWIKGGIYALIVVLILLFKATFSVFLLILAGVLIAVFFRGLSGLICRKTKWKEPLVQQKLVSISPALIIMAQLLISPLTGGWGLVLATPVNAYINDTRAGTVYNKKDE